MKRLLLPILLSFLHVFVFGCATIIPVTAVKPAKFDLQGARSIAVLPFGFPSQVRDEGLTPMERAVARFLSVIGYENPDEAAIAGTFASQINQALLNWNYFRVVSGSALESYLKHPTGTPPAEVYLTGEFTEIENQVTSTWNEEKQKDGSKRKYQSWTRTVTLTVMYEAIDAGTRTVFGSESKTLQRSSYARDPAQLASVVSLSSAMMDELVPSLVEEIQPTQATEYRSLISDDTKNPDMAQAEQLLKDGFLEKSYALYTQVYQRTRLFAAGYNAAIVKEVSGSLDEAMQLMKALADDSADKRALKEYQRMMQTRAETERAAAQAAGRK